MGLSDSPSVLRRARINNCFNRCCRTLVACIPPLIMIMMKQKPLFSDVLSSFVGKSFMFVCDRFVLLFATPSFSTLRYPSIAFNPRHHVSRKHYPLRLRFRPRYPRTRPRLRIRTVCQQRRLRSLLVVLLPSLRSNPPRIDCDTRSTAFSPTKHSHSPPQRFRPLLPIFVLRFLSFHRAQMRNSRVDVSIIPFHLLYSYPML